MPKSKDVIKKTGKQLRSFKDNPELSHEIPAQDWFTMDLLKPQPSSKVKDKVEAESD